MNIFQEKFSTGQIVKATGVSNATLQSWLKRGVIVGQRDADIEGGGSPGVHRRYSFFNLMEIATAKALIDAGISDLGFAFGAARSFAHIGDGAYDWQPERDPGLPFSNRGKLVGYTLLCVCQNSSYVSFWKPGSDPMPDIRTGLNNPLGFVVIDINKLFDRVVGTLGYHPQEILDFAYSRSGTAA